MRKPRRDNASRTWAARGVWLFALAAFALLGCEINLGDKLGNLCLPVCNGTRCDDGCGGVCECAPGTVCNSSDQCVDPGECKNTCEAENAECGFVCGENCGACGPNETCEDNRCVCEPKCDGTSCRADGCGGTCSCGDDKVCDPSEKCVDPGDCTATCESAARTCGSVCGEECGTCASNEICENGQCRCVDNCGEETCDPECGPGERCDNGQCVCEPTCADGKCDDGCGGSCCSGGELCDGRGECVDAAECADTCASAGRDCGEVCGAPCGTCGENETCKNGLCECEPKCDGTRCDDGCGGVCECNGGRVCDAGGACVLQGECLDTCEGADWACGTLCGKVCGECGADADCRSGVCVSSLGAIQLSLQKSEREATWTKALFVVDYAPREKEARGRMLDLRFVVPGDVACDVDSVTTGPALSGAGKELYIDPLTNKPWRLRPDGTYQLLVAAGDITAELGAGHLLWLNMTCETTGEFDISLQRRHHTLAPFEADVALQGSAYDKAVTVNP